MLVELKQYTQNGTSHVASMARVCYGNVTSKGDVELAKKVIGAGHLSLLEHVSYTFVISGVSRVLTHQLVRHRMASYAQESQRYVEFDSDYIVPESIKGNAENEHLYQNCMIFCEMVYNALLKDGVPKEDARYILPSAMHTKIAVTMNGRELYHFFKLRCCNRAQWEIRKMANEMLRICREVEPDLFAYAGKACEFGECPEGDMSCGGGKK